MAFANLFTSLSAVEDDVKRPDVQLAPTCRYLILASALKKQVYSRILFSGLWTDLFCVNRNETGKGNRGTSKKRKSRDEQTGPFSKVSWTA